MNVRHVNPEGLPHNPAFSQAVVVESPTKTIYVGGQNGVDASGRVVGDTVAAQSAQDFANLATVLAAEGATLADIVSWTIAVVDGQPLLEGFAAFQQVWDPARPAAGDLGARRGRPGTGVPGGGERRRRPLTAPGGGGASWNRTNDLALIRGAL